MNPTTLQRNKQKYFWLHFLDLIHLDSISKCHWKMEVSRTWSFTHHDINQPSKAFFAIWATVFSRKSAHQRACGWQHILGYYCSERGRLLLSEPDSISFYVLKGHCALSSIARVSFTGWKSKLWGLAQLLGLGVAPSWDVQPSSV